METNFEAMIQDTLNKYEKLHQDYDAYTQESHEVWTILFDRMMELLPTHATQAYIDGLPKINFVRDHIPNFEEVNKLLYGLTGWKVYVVPGLVPDKDFFELMTNRFFPATTWIRKKSQLDYLQEPDMFHDVFGHVPLLTNQAFVDFLEKLSKLGLNYVGNAWAIELISRIYWFTVEFGLIRENNELRVSGAGILSSAGETQYSLHSDIPERRSYDVLEILREPYIKSKYQVKYWIIESYEQLYESIPEIEKLLAQEVEKGPEKEWLETYNKMQAELQEN